MNAYQTAVFELKTKRETKFIYIQPEEQSNRRTIFNSNLMR